MTRSVYLSPLMKTQMRAQDFSQSRVLEAFDSSEIFDPELMATIILAKEGEAPIVRVQGGGVLPREIEVFRTPERTALSPIEGSNDLSVWCQNQGTVILHILGDTQSLGAIRLVHLFDPAELSRTDSVRIEVTPNSTLSLIEECVTPKGLEVHELKQAALFAGRCELQVGANARVQHLFSVSLSKDCDLSWVNVSRAGRNAQVELTAALSGHAKNRVAWFTDCAEEGADVRFKGVAKAEPGQRVDLTNDTFHSASRTNSQTLYQTVLSERSQTVFGGMIHIPKTSIGCEAIQKNQNLLLSPTAIAKSFPQLEIETDEVKCAHGATVSPVSEDQIYYMQARGISRKEAESMIVAGATEPVVSRFPTEVSKARAREVLA